MFEGFHDKRTLPIKPGQMVTIKKGVMVRTVGREPKPAGKTYRVKVAHLLSGAFRPGDSECQNPSVCWAGPGGYWSEVDINDVPEAKNKS